MMQLPRLPEHESFQATDHKWIGNVPSHWELRANKYIFSLKKQAVGKRSAEYDLLSLTLRGIIKRDMENPEGKFPAEFDTYQEVSPGDFVFCHFDVEETPRTVGLSDFHGMITGAYTVYRTRKSVDPRFLLYFYLNADSNKKLRSLYTGLRNTISKDAFASFKTPIPPLPEQRAIAAFLDDKCAKIDGAVKIKEDQIALLRERRQIIIQDAVTHGLNPAAPMKESGIDWIGQIPAHWERRKIRHLFSIGRGRVIPKEELVEDGLYPVYSSQTKNDGIFGYLNSYDFDQDQLTWTTDGANAGTVFRRRGKHNCTNVCGTLSPKTSITELDFCVHAVGHAALFYKRPDTNGAKIMNEEMAAIEFPLPPMEEQILISKKISEVSEKFENAYSIKERQIAALKEYKTSLINAAVTGKIKVI